MAIVDELKAVYYLLVRSVKDFLGGESNAINRYLKEICIGLGVILLGLGGYFGYRWYVTYREQGAHHALADYLHDYQLVSQADTPAELQRVESLFSLGYTRHKNSSIAPLFLALRSDAQLKEGNDAAALDGLQQAISALPSDSPVVPLFKLKRALILLDSPDDTMQKNGLQELVVLARDKENQYNDMALFYLGRYYWAIDNVADAKKAWQELVDSGWSSHQVYPSPWIQEASDRLKQIVT